VRRAETHYPCVLMGSWSPGQNPPPQLGSDLGPGRAKLASHDPKAWGRMRCPSAQASRIADGPGTADPGGVELRIDGHAL